MDLDGFFARLVFALLVLLGLSQACAGCSADVGAAHVEASPESLLAFPSVAPPATADVAPAIARAELDLPDTCDKLVAVETPSGRQLTKRVPAWLKDARQRAAHQAEARMIVEVVAAELGADPTSAELLVRKAIHESSGNWGAVHVRSSDVEANRRAARRGRLSTSERWSRARVDVHETRRGRLVVVGTYDAWALGRGLYGQVSGLHMSRWSSDAPPWSLCDPIVATVTTIWSMRAGLIECRRPKLRDAYRRFSSGRCAIREPKLERGFDRLARGHVRGLKLAAFDAEALADFGTRWPEETTDRAELLAVLRARVEARRRMMDFPRSK
jgi:hypothetical protein